MAAGVPAPSLGAYFYNEFSFGHFMVSSMGRLADEDSAAPPVILSNLVRTNDCRRYLWHGHCGFRKGERNARLFSDSMKGEKKRMDKKTALGMFVLSGTLAFGLQPGWSQTSGSSSGSSGAQSGSSGSSGIILQIRQQRALDAAVPIVAVAARVQIVRMAVQQAAAKAAQLREAAPHR